MGPAAFGSRFREISAKREKKEGPLMTLTGDLKCQEPRRHAPGKQPGRHMHEYTSFVPGVLVVILAMYILRICLSRSL